MAAALLACNAFETVPSPPGADLAAVWPVLTTAITLEAVLSDIASALPIPAPRKSEMQAHGIPTYITTHNNARSLIRKIDRDELLKAMVRTYLGE